MVNLDAPQGELRVEALNGANEIISRSEPLSGDLMGAEVVWGEGRYRRASRASGQSALHAAPSEALFLLVRMRGRGALNITLIKRLENPSQFQKGRYPTII
jgi:hypothetical protein